MLKLTQVGVQDQSLMFDRMPRWVELFTIQRVSTGHPGGMVYIPLLPKALMPRWWNGIHAGLKILWLLALWVRIPPWAHYRIFYFFFEIRLFYRANLRFERLDFGLRAFYTTLIP